MKFGYSKTTTKGAKTKEVCNCRGWLFHQVVRSQGDCHNYWGPSRELCLEEHHLPIWSPSLHAPIWRSTRGNRCLALNEFQFPEIQPRTHKTLWYHSPFEKNENSNPTYMTWFLKFLNSQKSIKNSVKFHL